MKLFIRYEEIAEDFMGDRWKYFAMALDSAVFMCVAANEKYAEKKYADKIRSEIKALCSECRSFMILKQMKKPLDKYFAGFPMSILEIPKS